MIHTDDTIAAISTPLFRGGLGIIRLSGPDAICVADAVFRGRRSPCKAPSHTALHGHMIDPSQNEQLDEVLCIVMRAPHTYTGEDVVEFTLHGSPLLLQRALEVAKKAGARQAAAGEFTFRAYLNGCMSLTQAEAVHQMITAQSEAGLRNAFLQLKGSLQRKISRIRDDVLEVQANFEAEIEYPGEGLNFLPRDRAVRRLRSLHKQVTAFADTYSIGRKLEEGLGIVICGPPNSGKSTLLNRLVREERAIVHHQPGTTRDVVEGHLDISGAVIRLFDTAGIRDVAGAVEATGIRRTYDRIARADLVLWIESVDPADAGNGAFFEHLSAYIREPHGERRMVRLLNKSDTMSKSARDRLKNRLTSGEEHLISAKRGWGIAGVRRIIEEMLKTLDPGVREGAIVTSARQKDLLHRCGDALDRAAAALARDVSLEYVCEDLVECRDALNELIGAEPRKSIYDLIFAHFCIGK